MIEGIDTIPVRDAQILRALHSMRDFIYGLEDIRQPFYSDYLQGVALFPLDIIIPLRTLDREEMSWTEAAGVGASYGLRLPTIDEWYYIRRHRAAINKLLQEHGGDDIDDNFYWSGTQCRSSHALYINLYSGTAEEGFINSRCYTRFIKTFKF